MKINFPRGTLERDHREKQKDPRGELRNSGMKTQQQE
jgi:hypothetical protein